MRAPVQFTAHGAIVGGMIGTVIGASMAATRASGALPVFDHVVIVVEENHGVGQIAGSSAAPYLNGTLGTQGALLTSMFGEEHHSEGNYHWLFAGSNFNMGFSDPVPVGPYNAANLGAGLISTGHTFKGYSETCPHRLDGDGFGPLPAETQPVVELLERAERHDRRDVVELALR